MERFLNSRWFPWISWGVTTLLVLASAAFVFIRKGDALFNQAGNPAQPIAILPTPTASMGSIPGLDTTLPGMLELPSVKRDLVLDTAIPERDRTRILTHVVEQGDSVFGISKTYDISPDSLLWANYATLNDDPHSIRPGVELSIPPTNGILYEWQEGDTLQAVAEEYNAEVADILGWIGNNIDLTDPQIEPGTLVMVPGGSREYKQWLIPTVARGSSGTANASTSACGGGPVGSGAFLWPSANHFLSGNDYYAGHLAIDIAGAEGDGVWASDAGVVTKADTGWNYGYGNVVMIDHGNGYATLYGHLSVINVAVCQPVYAGTYIGAIGNTGNSFGAHLHFEVRLNGGFINPWNVLGQ